MIVVIGSPFIVPGDPGRRSTAAGRPIDVARGAIDGGGAVQLVGKIGDDPAGDALLLALADAGIGHVALLRDPARATPVAPIAAAIGDALILEEDDGPFAEASAARPADSTGPDEPVPTIDGGDLDLALRYLPDHVVVVVAERLDADAMAIVVADCGYVGAVLVVILEPGSAPPELPLSATVFEAPDRDPEGLFGRTVGGFAAALDRGERGAEALARATAGAGWQPAAS